MYCTYPACLPHVTYMATKVVQVRSSPLSACAVTALRLPRRHWRETCEKEGSFQTPSRMQITCRVLHYWMRTYTTPTAQQPFSAVHCATLEALASREAVLTPESSLPTRVSISSKMGPHIDSTPPHDRILVWPRAACSTPPIPCSGVPGTRWQVPPVVSMFSCASLQSRSLPSPPAWLSLSRVCLSHSCLSHTHHSPFD